MNKMSTPPPRSLSSEGQHFPLLILAFFLGLVLRFFPVALSGFPVNDGGMFYVMVEELVVNHFVIPDYTGYNLSGIPFAYPPFGLYVTAIISTLLRIPVLEIVRWLPPMVSSLSLLVFYLMATDILESKTQAALAALFYGLIPGAFEWVVMGGGITRSFGYLFMFLTVTYANRLFTRPGKLPALLSAIFGALAFLSHPETGIQAAEICILLWIFRGRNWKTFFYSAGVALGVVGLTSSWWGNILATHGTVAFQSAMQMRSSANILLHLLNLLMLQFGGGLFFNVIMALALGGLLALLARREFLLVCWLILPFLIVPRISHWMVLIPLALLAAYGFDVLIAPALMSLRSQEGFWLKDRFISASLFVITIYVFFSASLFGLVLAGASLSSSDRETIVWVNENIPSGSDFVLLTGEALSMQDSFQEWFPALSHQHSQTTLQGLEWTLGNDFFTRHSQLVRLQNCTDIDCVERWEKETGLEYQYLLVKTSPAKGDSPLKNSLAALLKSTRLSSSYDIVYESETAVVFEKKGR